MVVVAPANPQTFVQKTLESPQAGRRQRAPGMPRRRRRARHGDDDADDMTMTSTSTAPGHTLGASREARREPARLLEDLRDLQHARPANVVHRQRD